MSHAGNRPVYFSRHSEITQNARQRVKISTYKALGRWTCLNSTSMHQPCLCHNDSRLAATKKHNLQALPERKADIARCQRAHESSPQLQRKVRFFIVHYMPTTDSLHPSPA